MCALKVWSTRDLTGKNYVYVWVDGVHFNIRLGEQDRQCIPVILGATADGKKELIAVADGFRESEQSWTSVLLDVKSRGKTIDPKLAVGDGALGFWKALPQVFPSTRVQRCWVHKSANVLNKLPETLHGAAKDLLHQIWMAGSPWVPPGVPGTKDPNLRLCDDGRNFPRLLAFRSVINPPHETAGGGNRRGVRPLLPVPLELVSGSAGVTRRKWL